MRAVAAAALVLPLFVGAPGALPVSADDPPADEAVLEFDKGGPGSVLAGETIRYSLRASNTGNLPGFNLTFRDVLPAGVTYQSGSTSPAEAGDPEIISGIDPVTEQPITTLIWSNVADLQAADTFTLSFTVLPDPLLYPVGSVVDNDASAYVNEDERWIPAFDADGVPIDPGAQNGEVRRGDDETTTLISSIRITKTEPSPEGELLRGVHTQATTYTLRVRTTGEGEHTDTVIVDRLPAGMEYLGCGSTDNSSDVEFPGSGPLEPVGALDPWDEDDLEGCLLPDTVDTVDEDGVVFTVLTWNLGELDPGDEAVIRYRAGIPLRENTLDFQGPTPTPESLEQGANIDNNTGASTREGVASPGDPPGEASLTNEVRVDAVYLGLVIDGLPQPLPVSDTDTETVTIEDVRMRKSLVSPGRFIVGEIATFRIIIDVSEYVDASEIVVTDVLPDGMCPMVTPSEGVYPPPPGNPSANCAPIPAGDLTTDVVSVSHDASTGRYTVVFDTIESIPADGSVTIEYQARMLANYTRTSLQGVPIVVGDSFTNNVSLLGQTDPIDDTGEQGTFNVGDDSSASLGTGDLSLAKLILPRYTDSPEDPTLLPDNDDGVGAAGCPANPAAYIDPDTLDGFEEGQVAFRLGDVVCFLLEVEFPDEVFVRNPVVDDLLPFGVEYVEGSAVAATGNTATFVIDPDPAPESGPTFLIGDVGTGGDRFSDLGDVFLVVLAGEIVDIPDGNDPDVRGNLMKMRTENTAGQARSYRDGVEFLAVPGVQVELLKGVASVDTPEAGPYGPNEDGETVQRLSNVTYRIDVRNTGTPENFTDVSARGIEIWDLLPPLIECNRVSGISAWLDPDDLTPTSPPPEFGACLDPGDGGYPPSLTTAGETRSVIRWQFPSPDVDGVFTVAPDELDSDGNIEIDNSRTLTYTVQMPADLSAGLNGDFRIENRAGVRELQGFSNVGGETATFIPENNIDPDPEREPNTAAADDISWVVTPDTSVVKSGVTSITQTNNNAPNQAVIGERVTYTYSVDVPPQTAVHDGVLSDSLPTNLVVVPLAEFTPEWRFYEQVPGSAVDPGDRPEDFTLDVNTGTLTFPGTHLNDTNFTQRFEVVVTARVIEGSLNQTDQPNRTNTATFTSNATPGGDALPAQDDDYTVRILQPVPELTKSNDVDGVATGGDTVEFTLVAGASAENPGSIARPPLHQSVVVDCLPLPLEFQSETVRFDGVLADADDVDDQPGDGANGCPLDTTRLEFTLGTIEPGVGVTITYEVLVPDAVVGGDEFTNTAQLTGNSLLSTDPNAVDGREYSTTDDSSFDVRPLGLDKSVTPDSATIGDQVTYTIEVVIPKDQNFFQATIVDSVPAGLTGFDFVGSTCVEDGDPCDPAVAVTFLGPSPADPALPSTIAFAAGDLTPADEARTLTITYTAIVADIESNSAGTLRTNTAVARWSSEPGGDPVNEGNFTDYEWDRASDDDTATVRIIEPDLSITKAVAVPEGRAPARPEPGDTFTYTVTVTNATGINRSAAYDIEITDVVPLGVVVNAATVTTSSGTASLDPTTVDPTDPTRGGGEITWTFAGPLAPGASMTLTYEATLPPSDAISLVPANSDPPDVVVPPFVNTATIEEYFSLPDELGNEGRREYTGPDATASVTPAFPTLTTTKTVLDGPPVYLGDEVRWRIVVSNAPTAGTAFDVDVVDTLPPNWTYVSGSATVVPGPTPPASATPAVDDSDPLAVTLTWTDLTDLEPGESVTIEFLAVPGLSVVTDPGIGGSIPHVNEAVATADDSSGEPGNADGPYTDDDDADTRIDAVDLLLVKDGPATVVSGTNITWTITVSNPTTDNTDNPTDTAVGPFEVVDTLPLGVEFVSATGAGWTCGFIADTSDLPLTGGTVTCNRTNGNDTLAPNGAFPAINLVVGVPADVPAEVEYVNTATVDGRTFERNPDDNTDTDTVVTTVEADLAVAKTGPATVTAGGSVTWQVVVTNLGPSDSVATSDDPITTVDALPPGTTFVSADGGENWTCDGTTTPGEVTCTYPLTLTPNQAAPAITIVADVASDVPPTDPEDDETRLVNNVTVTPGLTPDPNDENDTDDHPSDVETSADLGIVKERTDPEPPASVVAGSPVTWTLTVSNFGPSDAAVPVTIVDTLPDGFTYASHTGPWDCDVDEQEVTCVLVEDPSAEPVDLQGLAGGTTDNPVVAPALVLTADTDPTIGADEPGDPFEYVNTATVSSPTDDPNPDNDTDTEGSGVGSEADLEVVKSGPDTADAGERISWTITVTNNGPSVSDASADDPITVTDTLPLGVDHVSSTGTGWDCTFSPDTGQPPTTGGTVSCDRETSLANGASAPAITVTVDIDPSAGPGSITNSATVTPGETTDPIPDNNTDDDTVTITEDVELTIEKLTTGPGSSVETAVLAGETTEFTIVVTNDGPSTARQVTVVDTMPTGLSAIGASGDGWVCTPTPTPAAPATTVSCTLAELLPGESTPLVIAARVASNVGDGTTLTNPATVSTVTPGDDPDNNTDTSDVVVIAEADLAITKTHAEDQVVAGADVVFTIGVQNLGPSDAVAPVTVTDTLPPGFRYVTASGPWSCTAAGQVSTGQTVTCTLLGAGQNPAPLAAGATAGNLLMTVSTGAGLPPSTDPDDETVDPIGYLNVVVVDSPTDDPNPDNDEAEDPVVIVNQTNISIAKTHTGTVRIGEPFTFELRVTNDGPSEARDVRVVDTVPTALELISVTGTGWTCSTVNRTVTCDRNSALAPGATAPAIRLNVRPTVAAYPSVTNTATVSTSTPETTLDDNTDSDTVSVPPLVNLQITKTSGDDFVVGQSGSYTLTVTNTGPTSDPGPVTVVDVLPAGLTPVSVSPASACTISGQRVECSLPGVLTVGSTRTVTINVDIGPAAAPSVTNTATVSTPSEETTLDDNTDSDTRPVQPVWSLSVDKRVGGQMDDLVSWDILVTNLGPSPTGSTIVAVDQLDPGLQFVSTDGAGWNCRVEGQVVTCEHPGAVPAGNTVSFTIVTRVIAPEGTAISNSVVVEDEAGSLAPVTDTETVSPTPSPPAPPTTTPSPSIPITGTDPGPILALALALLLLGLGLRWGPFATRRPRPVIGSDDDSAAANETNPPQS